MAPPCGRPEHRRSTRRSRSDAMFWQPAPDRDLAMGWLLDASADGFAFAHRGDPVPSVGAVIGVCLSPRDIAHAPADAVVRRVIRVHDDLIIVGAELLHDRPMSSNAATVQAA